jgi:hypothetical protein
MKILQNGFVGLSFQSAKGKSNNEGNKECRRGSTVHSGTSAVPFYSIYEKDGADPQFENLVGTLSKSAKVERYPDIYSLPLKNIEKIEGTDNSYRGQTLLTANKKCMETIKNAGIKTVVDLEDFIGYDKKIEDAGMNYFSYKMQGIWDSPVFESYYRYMDRQKQLLSALKDGGLEFDLDDKLELCREKFNERIKAPKEKFIEFINVMQDDNIYIGCEHGTYMTDTAMLLNDAFNPKRSDRPILAQNPVMVDRLWILHSNLTDEDKQKMGWDKETDERFYDRMFKAQDRVLLGK